MSCDLHRVAMARLVPEERKVPPVLREKLAPLVLLDLPEALDLP